jgi:hypothetical protein
MEFRGIGRPALSPRWRTAIFIGKGWDRIPNHPGCDMTTDRKRTSRTDARGAEAPVAASDHVPVEARQKPAAPATSDADVAEFVRRMKSLAPQAGVGRGRLVFAMDATMSRQPTWDMALALQADMFDAVKAVGGLDVQLVYFRGAGECAASRWVSDPQALAALMTRVHCAGGYTQIRKVLSHARGESAKKPVNALVYVGDCMEEDIDDL